MTLNTNGFYYKIVLILACFLLIFGVIACKHASTTDLEAPEITTADLPYGTVGVEYNQTLTATGNTPIKWKIIYGSLPDGLFLTADDIISGTPSKMGRFDFTVGAENRAGNTEKVLSIIINGITPEIISSKLPFGIVGKDYKQTLNATGMTPIKWEVTDGVLPDGLSLSEDGIISGTPTDNRISIFTIKARNAAGDTEKTFFIHISLIDMALIPSGKFTMGSPITEAGRFDNEIQHQVTLTKDFYMGIYQVTQEQYMAIIGSNPSNFSESNSMPAAEDEVSLMRPVETVSWYDALVFCNKLSIKEGLTPAYSINGVTNPDIWGPVPTSDNATWNAVVIVAGSTGFRLPTEAQWEYACRANTTTAFNDGNDSYTDATLVGQVAWYRSNSETYQIYGRGTHEVGKKNPNKWGLYNMHKNVLEWCWDWYGDYSALAQTDPPGESLGNNRVFRGGVWENLAHILRSACRANNFPSTQTYGLGFRLVRP